MLQYQLLAFSVELSMKMFVNLEVRIDNAKIDNHSRRPVIGDLSLHVAPTREENIQTELPVIGVNSL